MEENKIIVYQDDNEVTRVSVRFADEGLWLNVFKAWMDEMGEETHELME